MHWKEARQPNFKNEFQEELQEQTNLLKKL